MRIRMPDIKTAVSVYHSYTELGNKEINELYGGLAPATISKLKKMARKIMIEEKVSTWNETCVNTKVAFRAWDIDIVEYEKKLNKMMKMGIIKPIQEYDIA